MSRALLVLSSRAIRDKAINWINRAPPDTRVEFKEKKRSLAQNDLLWARLTDVSVQKMHAGRRYTTDEWKCLFMHACGREVQFLQSLDNSTFVPYGFRSSDLSAAEMSDLIDFIGAWGAENGIVWSDPTMPRQEAEAMA